MMASSYHGDIKVSTGTYNDPQTGVEKKRWLKIGAAFVDENGNMSLKFEALPLAKPEGTWAKIFTNDNNNQSQQRPQQGQQQQQAPQQQSAPPPQTTGY